MIDNPTHPGQRRHVRLAGPFVHVEFLELDGDRAADLGEAIVDEAGKLALALERDIFADVQLATPEIGRAHRLHQRIEQEGPALARHRSEEHTSELQSLMRISYAVFCLKKKNKSKIPTTSATNPQNYNHLHKSTHTTLHMRNISHTRQ